MQDNQDIIYGIHPVLEALKSKKRNVTQLYVSDSKAGHRTVEEIIRLAKRTNVRIDRIENKVLDRLRGMPITRELWPRCNPLNCSNFLRLSMKQRVKKMNCGWPWMK